MMVLSFNWPIEHDNTVALVVDGELIFATEEERYTRHKHSPAEPPFNAFKKLFDFMRKNGLKPQEIDAFAVNYNYKKFSLQSRISSLMQHTEYMAFVGTPILLPYYEFAKMVFNLDLSVLAKKFIFSIYKKAGEKPPENIRIIPVDHHLAHAASAYYFSGFNNCAGIVVDGSGEYEATTIWKIKNGNFEKLLSLYTSFGSVGFFYENASKRVGYEFLEGPGKLMGLAPYGKRSKYYDRLKEFIKFNEDGLPFYFTVNKKDKLVTKSLEKIDRFYNGIFDQITKEIKWDKHGKDITEAANFAWAVQKIAEEAILATAEFAKRETGEDKLVMAGGVALNAKANMELYYSKMFNDIFIFPAANDAGTTIGAAAYVYEHVLGGKMKNKRLENVYLGPEYEDEEIKKVVESSKLKYEYIGEDVGEVARMVKKGKIVTWYQGRAELGPRALGNRSIVADPTIKENWRIVNKIKGREWWRPLAPSLLSESKSEYFVDPTDHEFMIMMFRFNEGLDKRVPAVFHVDGTARPQTVKYKQNKNWYNLIKAFGEESGENIIINTSFNLAGEPLVETPKDAIRSFALGGFDALYMQGYLIKKR